MANNGVIPIDEIIGQDASEPSYSPTDTGKTFDMIPIDSIIEGKAETVAPKGPETIESMFRGSMGTSKLAKVIEPITVDGILAPLAEVARGMNQGGNTLFTAASNIASLLDVIPGIHKTGVFDKAADYLAQQATVQKAMADAVPPTEMLSPLKLAYNVFGQAPAVYSQYEAAGKLLGTMRVPEFLKMAKAERLSNTTQMALVNAIDQFDPNNPGESLAKGAVEGFESGMTFDIATTGLGILKNVNKKVAKAYVKAVTGSDRAAKDLVENPRKYDFNPWSKKVKTNDEIVKEYADAKDILSKEKLDAERDFMFKQKEELDAYKLNLKDTQDRLKEVHQQSRDALVKDQGITLQDITQKTNKAIADSNNLFQEQTGKVFENANIKLQQLEKQSGEAVGAAIDHLTAMNPNAGMDSRHMFDRWKKVVDEYSTYHIETGKKGMYENTFKAMEEVFNENAKASPTINLQYLQKLKDNLQEMAQGAFANKSYAESTLFSELSKAINPANNLVATAGKAEVINTLAKANSEFSTYIPKYKEAMKQFYKKDANGVMIPDPAKAINAIKNNDIGLLKQMEKADAALLPEDRILPKMRELYNASKQTETIQMGIVKNLKEKSKQELDMLNRANRDAQAKLVRSHRILTREEVQTTQKALNEFRDAANENYKAAIEGLDNVLNFGKDQNLLRSLRTQGKLTQLTQRAMQYGMMAGAGGTLINPSAAVPALAGSTALFTLLSPVVAGSTAKRMVLAGEGAKKLYDTFVPEQSRNLLKQLLGSKVLKNKND